MNATISNHTTLPNPLPSSYVALCALHIPRPIHDKTEFFNTREIVNALAVIDELNEDQSDYLEILAEQIEQYEKATLPKPRKISGRATLKFLLKEHGMNAADLAKVIGVDRSDGYKILAGDRELSVNHIRRLSQRFGVSSDAFL